MKRKIAGTNMQAANANIKSSKGFDGIIATIPTVIIAEISNIEWPFISRK